MHPSPTWIRLWGCHLIAFSTIFMSNYKQQPSKEPAGLLSSAQPARQTDIRFWAVRADCSPSSGSAIVARVKWMGSEPEMVLNKPPLVSNNRTDCIQNRTVFTGGWSVTNNKHSVSHTYTEMTVDTHTVHPLPPPSPLLPNKSGEQHSWTPALLEWSAVTGLAGRERAWRHASLPPRAVIIKIHYTLKMELLEPNCCQLNYLENTLWPQHILIICSCSRHFLFHPLGFGKSLHEFQRHSFMDTIGTFYSWRYNKYLHLCLCYSTLFHRQKYSMCQLCPIFTHMEFRGRESQRAAFFKSTPPFSNADAGQPTALPPTMMHSSSSHIKFN